MKVGKQTIKLENTPSIIATGSVVGPKESEGPIANYFDTRCEDVFFGEKTFEKAESKYMKTAIDTAISKTGMGEDKIDCIFAGDLLNQCIASAFCLRDVKVPFLGLYGACSTFCEGLMLASLMVNAGYAKNSMCAASSNFCSSERQFRMPLEHGNQRPPTAQYTVTGAGAAIVSTEKSVSYPKVTYVTMGRVVDLGVKDMANMGAAMAPAAMDTIITHLEDTARKPDYYDLIVTGDLGREGSDILIESCKKYGIDISKVHKDCGTEIFDLQDRDINCGGSGCGCMAATFSGYFYSKLRERNINKILIVATGALMSTVSVGQGESIPGIAHAVAIENEV